VGLLEIKNNEMHWRYPVHAVSFHGISYIRKAINQMHNTFGHMYRVPRDCVKGKNMFHLFSSGLRFRWLATTRMEHTKLAMEFEKPDLTQGLSGGAVASIKNEHLILE
jgi:hypothetical protein